MTTNNENSAPEEFNDSEAGIVENEEAQEEKKGLRAHFNKHKNAYIKGAAAVVVSASAFFLLKPSKPEVREVEAVVTGQHTEMQIDPQTEKPFKAYIIETTEGNFEGDAFYKQATPLSREDASCRQETLQKGEKYLFITVEAKGMKQPGILQIANPKKPAEPKP